MSSIGWRIWSSVAFPASAHTHTQREREGFNSQMIEHNYIVNACHYNVTNAI